MVQYGTWRPYSGIGALILALVLMIVVGVLITAALRLRQPLAVQRPGSVVRVAIGIIWFLAILTFLVAATVYVLALVHQVGQYIGPKDPITPVTLTSAVVAFFTIVFRLAQRQGFWVAYGSALVGAIAAPMIFELPFDMIVMWRTYPPAPAALFTLLYFGPLFMIEIATITMLTFSPCVRLTRVSLLCLAGMFAIFGLWALFGFAYPATPIPTALNMLSKIAAFATAVALFDPHAPIATTGARLTENQAEHAA